MNRSNSRRPPRHQTACWLGTALCLGAGGLACDRATPKEKTTVAQDSPADGVTEPKPKPVVDSATSKLDIPPTAADPAPDPPPPPSPPPITATIASVQMIQDCDGLGVRKPTRSPGGGGAAQSRGSLGSPAQPSRGVGGSGSLPRAPCTQSTVQIEWNNPGQASTTVAIGTIALLDAKTRTQVATLAARTPTQWQPASGTYATWDGVLKAALPLKSSHALSVPRWSDVETKLGGKTSVGHSLVIVVDITTETATLQLESPPFVRERPHVIST